MPAFPHLSVCVRVCVSDGGAVCLQVCLAAVGLVCDLCRSLSSNILPYCDTIMELLLENLGVSVSVSSTHPRYTRPACAALV